MNEFQSRQSVSSIVSDYFQYHGLQHARLPCPGDLSNPGNEPSSPVSPVLVGGFFTSEPPWRPVNDILLFSCSVVSYSFQPHGLQHPRISCPSLSPGACSNHVHWVCNAIWSSYPLSLPSPPVFNLSQYQGFSNESALHIRWPKYWNFSFSISSFNEYSGLTSFRIDWFDLLAVQGTHKSVFQHHNSKLSILQQSAFFMI